MKKTIFCAFALLGLLTACDPTKDDISMPNSGITSEELAQGFSVVQYSDAGCTTEAADGNYMKFTTNPSRVVRIYQVASDGSETVLSSGTANGTFSIVPKRGNSSTQIYYVEAAEFDGTKIVTEMTVNVYVPTELSTEMRLFASDAYGKKIWKWDTEFRSDGGAWGNLGYAPGDGDSFVNDGNGIWFGCPPDDLESQLQHSDTGSATGEESVDAYMEFYEDGTILTYSAGGNQIRSGSFSVSGYTGERNHASVDGSQAAWSLGTLTTTEGAILFPFQINGGGTKPTNFEIMQLDANHLKLIYAPAGTSSWGEATWWAFKSDSDAEGSLTGFGEKSWTWDTEFREDGGAWGNLGYAPGDGTTFVNDGNGIWFGCPPDDLAGQLQHSDTGKETGEESAGAYMTFNWANGTVKSYAADGTEIRSGSFSVSAWDNGNRSFASVDGSQAAWSLGTLTTTAGSILFPFQINGGGTKPTDFEIMQLDGNHLKLIYAPAGTGGWGEATWWAFKKK